ncbi:MAG: phytanoyl-CoA dioxygenase family protein [Pseudonocardiales bacterium]|nr:phytanoyl-CoA dioxygenase family protein [Pseudonocardiales bacterium]
MDGIAVWSDVAIGDETPVRILYLTKFPPLQGGMATRGLHLSVEFARRGHQVSVVTDALHAGPHERVAGPLTPLLAQLPPAVHVYWTESSTQRLYLHHPGGRDAMAQVSSVALAAAEAFCPDVVLSAYLQPYGLAGHVVARELGVGHAVMHAGSDVGRLMRARDNQHLFSRVLIGAGTVFTSPHHRLALANTGVRLDRLVSLPVPLPPWAGGQYQPLDPATRRVVFLGKLNHPDHVEDLILRCDALGLALHLVGQFAYPDRWRASELVGARARPFVWPWQVPDELRQSCGVVASEPSSVEIPGHLGLKAVEAAAAGRPVCLPARLSENFGLSAADIPATLEDLARLLDDPARAIGAGRALHDWTARKITGADRSIVGFREFADRVEAALSSLVPPVGADSTPSACAADPDLDIAVQAAQPVLAVVTDHDHGAQIGPETILCRRVPTWVTRFGDGSTHVLAQSAGVHRREFRMDARYIRLLEQADGSSPCAVLTSDAADWMRLRKLVACDLLAVLAPGSPPPTVPPLVRRHLQKRVPLLRSPGASPERARDTALYRERGYLSADALLAGDLVDRVSVELDEILTWRPGRVPNGAARLVSSWQTIDGAARPRRINDLWAAGEAIGSLITDETVTKLATTLAPGVDLVYLSEQLLVKWPGPDSELSWHRDPGAPLGMDPELDFVIGVHFCENSDEAALDVVAGSHRWTRERCEKFLAHPPDIAGRQTVPLRPRSVTAHSRSILHRSVAHRGFRPRCSIYVHFVPLELAAGQIGPAVAIRRNQELRAGVRP